MFLAAFFSALVYAGSAFSLIEPAGRPALALDVNAPAPGPPGTSKWGPNHPRGVAVDASGNVYAADTNTDCIEKFSPDGRLLLKWGSRGKGNGQFNWPVGIAADESGNIYVADANNNRIEKFNPEGKYVGQWGQAGRGAGQFDSPEGIVVDPSGDIYVADADNNRVQKFSPDGKYLTEFGGAAVPPGQFGKTHVHFRLAIGGGPWPWQFRSPQGVAVDSSGDVYVADTGFSRIAKFAPGGRYLGAIGVSSVDKKGRVVKPRNLAVDSAGNVYAAVYTFTFSCTRRFQSGVYRTRCTMRPHKNGRIEKFSPKGNCLGQWGF